MAAPALRSGGSRCSRISAISPRRTGAETFTAATTRPVPSRSGAATERRPRLSLWLLRIAATAHLVLALVQPVLDRMYKGGVWAKNVNPDDLPAIREKGREIVEEKPRTTKAIGEMLVATYSPKGFLDGRALRLPTIIVRPGRPNRAASTFASPFRWSPWLALPLRP